jgi:hypothetical protein
VRDHALVGTDGSIGAGRRNIARFGMAVALVVCLVGFLGISAPTAGAAPSAGLGWKLRVSFTELVPVLLEPASNNVAVDSSGNIFRGNFAQGGVDVFAPDPVTGGIFLTHLTTPSSVPRNLAIDQSDDALYADGFSAFGDPTIHRYLSDGNPTPTYTVEPGFEVTAGKGIAVDPATHDLLVTRPGAEAVQRYSTAGALVETISTPGIAPELIASRPDGSFYVAAAAGPDVLHLSGGGAVIGTIAGVGSLRGLTWDADHSALIAATDAALKSYSSADKFTGESPAATAEGIGLAFDPVQGVLYEAAFGSKQGPFGQIHVYEPAVIPGVEPPAVSSVSGTGVHLSGEVEPGEGPPAESKAHFEYSADEGESWQSTPDQEFTAAGVATIEADLTGLLANQKYLVRVRATNSAANTASSPTSFSTSQIAPDAETTDASAVQETSAVLNGSINPNGLQTTYYFEYGTTTSYGVRAPVLVEGVAGGGHVSRGFSQALSALSPGTTYHYRLVARNAIGRGESADKTFTTAIAGAVAPNRSYEQVTPVNKEGAQILSDFHVQVSDQGSAIAIAAASGARSSESVMLRQNFVVRRNASGWEDWERTDPPQGAVPGVWESSTQAVSKDYKHAMVGSSRVLAPGAVAGDGNLYIKDLVTGSYTFIGDAPGSRGFGNLVGGNAQETVFAAGAPDFSWVLFWTDIPMLEGVTGRALYRWSEQGGLTLESVTPSGGIPPSPTAVVPNYTYALPPASADGKLTAFDPGPWFVFSPVFELGGGVYIRKDGGPSTPIAISQIAGAEPVNDSSSKVNWVTPDGRYVFFQSHSQLTKDAPATLQSDDAVYRYSTETGVLTYIGRKVGEFTFGFHGASTDGETVYLYNNDSSATGTTVWHDGVTHFITEENTNGSPRYMTPNGRFFAWENNGRAYLYDLDSDKTVCASCLPDGSTGSPAHIGSLGRNMGNQSVRSVTEDGTMFFDTKTALLPSDRNGSKDVYAFKGGHLSLISPGDADFDAFFVGASADGTDVYFQTDQGLVAKDTDGTSDVYDARAGGGFAEVPAPPKCSGEGCRGQASDAKKDPMMGSAATGWTDTEAAINSVKPLSLAQKKTLAKGGKVALMLKVSKAGKVSATGKAKGHRVIGASVQAKKAGSVSLPLKLSEGGLSELEEGRKLNVTLVVNFDGKPEKTLALTLKPVGSKKKGGHS